MKLLILTGASGAGKTAIAKKIAVEEPNVTCHFFDSLGVPSPKEMAERFGSGEARQRASTIGWLKRIGSAGAGNVLLEGQMRISFIREGLQVAGIQDAMIILVDCEQEERKRRLTETRGQLELANDQMMEWANFLRAEAQFQGIAILNTSQHSIEECCQRLRAWFDR